MPQSIIDGFYFAILIGIVPTLFIILYNIGNMKSGYGNKNSSLKTGSIIAIILGLLFAFNDSHHN